MRPSTHDFGSARVELIGHEVTFKFRYEDGTEVGEIKKTIRAERE